MKNSILALTLLLASAFSSYASAGPLRPCAGDSQPSVSVTARLIQPTIDHTVSVDELTVIAEKSRPGLADGLAHIQLDATFDVSPTNKKGLCNVGHVAIELLASSAKVFIAREVDIGSCRFKAVYDHELKHVMLAQRSMDERISSMRRAVLKSISEVLEHEAAAHHFVEMQQLIINTISTQVATLTAEFVAANRELDAPAEAHRLDEMCKGPTTLVGDRPMMALDRDIHMYE